MAERYSPEERRRYLETLPRKRINVGVFFINGNGEILFLKPNYRETWTIPGGAVDEGESPREAAIREVFEEIGLTQRNLRLIGVAYCRDSGKDDALSFVFWGGELSEREIGTMTLGSDEIEACRFMSFEVASPMLSDNMRRCGPRYLDALQNGAVVYEEYDGWTH